MKRQNLYRFAITMLLLSCLLTVSALAGNHAEWGYSQLDPNQKGLYETLEVVVAARENKDIIEGAEDSAKDYSSALDVSQWQLETDAVYETVRMFVADHPEYYWFDGAVSLLKYSDGKTAYMHSFQYTHTSEVEETAFEAASQDLLKDLPRDATNYEKTLYIHDKLAEHIDYDLNVAHEQTAYSAIVDGKAVCAGYARAYQYLLNEAGIDAWTVEGYSVDVNNPDNTEGVLHAWNLVWLNDQCYYTDVTWDDQG